MALSFNRWIRIHKDNKCNLVAHSHLYFVMYTWTLTKFLLHRSFGLFEGADARVITIQRERYGDTVHLFIGTRRNSGKITFMSLIFTVNYEASYQGLSSLFSFRSVPSFTIVIMLSRRSFSHSFDAHSPFLQIAPSYHSHLHLKIEASCNSLCYTKKHVS